MGINQFASADSRIQFGGADENLFVKSFWGHAREKL